MKKIILAVSSSGGHWDQLMELRSAFSDFEVIFANTLSDLGKRDGIVSCYQIPDCNRDSIIRSLLSFIAVARLVVKTQPHIVISTGAAPGLFAVLVGRVIGAHTIWIDSIANTEQLSMSGKFALRICHLHLTQWKHLATNGKSKYFGSIL